MKRFALFLTVALALLMTAGTANAANTNEAQTKDTTILGKLYFVNLKAGEQPVMKGLSLSGNRCGNEEFNHKPYATEGIRSVFELDEMSAALTTTPSSASAPIQDFYLKKTLSDKTPDYIQEQELNKDPDAEENSHWGSFYLHPEEVAPGYYDFVFIYNNKVIAIMPAKFYKVEEIYNKSNSELEQLMKQPIGQ